MSSNSYDIEGFSDEEEETKLDNYMSNCSEQVTKPPVFQEILVKKQASPSKSQTSTLSPSSPSDTDLEQQNDVINLHAKVSSQSITNNENIK